MRTVIGLRGVIGYFSIMTLPITPCVSCFAKHVIRSTRSKVTAHHHTPTLTGHSRAELWRRLMPATGSSQTASEDVRGVRVSRAYCGPSNRRRVYPPVYGDIGPARILFESGAHTPHPPYDVGRNWPASRTDVEGILRPPPPDSIGQ